MAKWQIQRGESPVLGPYTDEQVVEGIHAAAIPNDSKIRAVGDTAWNSVTDVPEFAAAARAVGLRATRGGNHSPSPAAATSGASKAAAPALAEAIAASGTRVTKAHVVGIKLEKIGSTLEAISVLVAVGGVVLCLLQWLNQIDLHQDWGPKSTLGLLWVTAVACLGWIVMGIGGLISAKIVGALGTGLATLGDILVATKQDGRSEDAR